MSKNFEDKVTDSQHLQFIHDRLIKVYGVSKNVDYLVIMRKIIKSHESCNHNDVRNLKFQEPFNTFF